MAFISGYEGVILFMTRYRILYSKYGVTKTIKTTPSLLLPWVPPVLSHTLQPNVYVLQGLVSLLTFLTMYLDGKIGTVVLVDEVCKGILKCNGFTIGNITANIENL